MPKARVNGIELYYELHGPAESRETVVFVNDVLANTTSWFNQLPLFSKEYRVLLYDCRGQGQSDKPAQDYTLELHAEDLNALLETLGIKRAHIVGISYGGEIGMTLALRYPKRVESLVMADSVSQVDALLEAKIEAWTAAAKTKDPKLFFLVTAPDIFSEGFLSQNLDFMRIIEEQYTKLDYDAVVRLIARFREFNLTPELSKIEAPTLIICGEQDTLKPVKYSQLIHQKILHSELFVVKDAGHAITYEKPQEFNTLVLGFLEKQRLLR